MKRNVLFILLLSAVMMAMGCGDTIIPCNTDEDCSFDMGGPSEGSSGMVCNLEMTALEKCESMQLPSFLDLPFSILEMDCSEFEGIEEQGVCEFDWSFSF